MKEFINQTQINEGVQKIRNLNIEKRVNEKVKTSVSKNFLTDCTKKVERKIQKDIFKSHQKILEQIWTIGRGLMFAKHLAELVDLKKAEMYRDLHFLEKAGLIKIIKYNYQNIIQLTQFSTNQFRKKTRLVSLTDANIIKHAFICEILVNKLRTFQKKIINRSSIDNETFIDSIQDQSNFCRFKNEEIEKELWITLDSLRKRNAFFQVGKDHVRVYLLDVYNPEADRMITRIVDIFEFLEDANVTDMFAVQFYVCVVDERRKKYLDEKRSRKTFNGYLMGKHLIGRFSIKIVSYDLTRKVFSSTRVVP